MGAWWGASSPSSVFKLVRKLSRVSHAAREIVTTFYVIFFIFLVTVVGQMVNSLPQWAHLCWVPEQATIKEGIKTFQRKIEGLKHSATFSSIMV